MAQEDEVDCRICLMTLAMVCVGFVPLLTIAALAYFTVETVAGRMDFCTIWTDIPGRLAIFTISYYVAGLCGYFPIPECCFINCLPKPLSLWRPSTWRKCLRSCLPVPIRYSRFRESPQISNSALPHSLRDTRQESLRDSSLIFHRRRSEPTEINVPQKSKVSVHVRPAAVGQDRTTDIIHDSSEDLFASADSPVGCIIPMPMRKSSKPHYLPSSLEGSTGQAEATHDPFKQIKDAETPPRTDDECIQLPNYPRIPWAFLRHPDGIPDAVVKAHKKNLKVEKNVVERQHRLQKEIDQHVARRVKCSAERRAEGELEANGSNQPPLQPQTRRSRRSHSRPQSRRRLLSLGSSKQHKKSHSEKSSQLEKVRQQEETGKCCEHSPDLAFKVERIKSMFRDSVTVRAQQGTKLKVETSREGADAGALGPGVPSTSKLEQVVDSRLQEGYTVGLDVCAGVVEIPNSSNQEHEEQSKKTG